MQGKQGSRRHRHHHRHRHCPSKHQGSGGPASGRSPHERGGGEMHVTGAGGWDRGQSYRATTTADTRCTWPEGCGPEVKLGAPLQLLRSYQSCPGHVELLCLFLGEKNPPPEMHAGAFAFWHLEGRIPSFSEPPQPRSPALSQDFALGQTDPLPSSMSMPWPQGFSFWCRSPRPTTRATASCQHQLCPR